MRHLLSAILLIAGMVGLAPPATAKVVKFEIVRVELPAFEGRSFGAVGTYDRIVARATVAVSPDDPHNKIIVDLDRAPRQGSHRSDHKPVEGGHHQPHQQRHRAQRSQHHAPEARPQLGV